MKESLKKRIAVNKRKKVDDDVSSLMDMVIGEYLQILTENQSGALVKQCKVGIRKVCTAFNINPKGLDVDNLI